MKVPLDAHGDESLVLVKTGGKVAGDELTSFPKALTVITGDRTDFMRRIIVRLTRLPFIDTHDKICGNAVLPYIQ